MLPDVPSRLTTAQAAALCRVKPATIRQWVRRGHLDYARDDQGRPLVDEQGYRLFDQLAVARAEAATRDHAHRDLRLLLRLGV